MAIPARPRDSTELAMRNLRVHRAPESDVVAAMDVIIGITLHGHSPGLDRCLRSVVCQDIDLRRVGMIVLRDGISAGHDASQVPPELLERTWLIGANCGNAARARNAVLDFVDSSLPNCRWVARLDCDDRLAEVHSLRCAVAIAERRQALFVLGGNRVFSRDGRFLRENRVSLELLGRSRLLDLLDRMASGTAENELPSCNLLLAAHRGIRYPDFSSAEDHRLVASLLVFHTSEGAIMEDPLYCDYTLDGFVTQKEREHSRHLRARQDLATAAHEWVHVLNLPGRILGFGGEGIVRLHEGMVQKHFYRKVIPDEHARWLDGAIQDSTIFPKARISLDAERSSWVANYEYEETDPVSSFDVTEAQEFLRSCLRERCVVGNIARKNFRRRGNGRLVCVDIGGWIRPMDVSVLRDSAARIFGIAAFGLPDDELQRRPADHSRPEVWDQLEGFTDFYRRTIGGQLSRAFDHCDLSPRHPRDPDVTLLMKCCAMDARDACTQIRHLVSQLVGPRDFAERILLIDPHPGPFVRPHAEPNLSAVRAAAEELLEERVLDRVLVSPIDRESVLQVNRDWFGLDCRATHSALGVPVTPQLWGFEQVRTRFVLQCDLDILVGRRQLEHDYLSEMMEACRAGDVVSVGFNIPHAESSEPRCLDAPVGEYKPEVRCGLLDLHKLWALRPLPASMEGGRIAQNWYHAVHRAQKERGFRSLRGGHPGTFYVHPTNDRKGDLDLLERARDLISQGVVPETQIGSWDLQGEIDDWQYPRRRESVVVLAKGRNTGPARLSRFARGLAMQDDQEFGVIVVDDGSSDSSGAAAGRSLDWLRGRLTLVRRVRPRGRMVNNVLAIRELCTNPESMIVIVDLDDALVDQRAISRVRNMALKGHDVVLAAPFRPDKPIKIYRPNFVAPREHFGGDVWIHLRAFKKRLFDLVPDAALQLEGNWVEHCEDYAVMLPIVELATHPAYVPEYLYWHERSTPRDPELRRVHDATIERLLSKPSLRPLRPGKV